MNFDKGGYNRRKIFDHEAIIEGLIYKLNSSIRGWANYFKFCSSYSSFSHLDRLMFRWIWSWCRRRHPHKKKRWIVDKYYLLMDGDKWRFKSQYWNLLHFQEIKRMKYGWKVGNMSPHNPKYRKMWRSKPSCNNEPLVS